VLARQQRPARGSVRYYLWSGDKLRRIPNRLHYGLLDRVVAFPEFAGSRQKAIEVFIRPLTSTTRAIQARGIVFSFDANGFLDLRPMRDEVIGDYIKGSPVRGNVVNFERIVQRKQFASTYAWEPTADMVARIKADIAPGRSKASKLPLLKNPK
jgi:hypothetical protein